MLRMHIRSARPSGIMPATMALYSSAFGASFSPWKANTDVAWNYRKLATDLYSQHTGPDSNFAAGAIGVTGYRPGAASYCQLNLPVAYTCHSGVRS